MNPQLVRYHHGWFNMDNVTKVLASNDGKTITIVFHGKDNDRENNGNTIKLEREEWDTCILPYLDIVNKKAPDFISSRSGISATAL